MQTNNKPAVIEAYQFCQQLAQSHYENFPVASILLPKGLRRPISVIYAFARTADDFADEGDASQEIRLEQLNNYHQSLVQIENQSYQGEDPIFIALADVIKQHQLPISLFTDLLSAFKQDVVKTRYADFNEVLDYCSRSANPVGRLLLHLIGSPSQTQLAQSDAICTALQLINFYQDIEQDYTENDRIYIPQDELAKAGLIENDILQSSSSAFSPLLRSLYSRTEQLLSSGQELGTHVTGRMGWEIRAMTLAGITTHYLLTQQTDDKLMQRPRLAKWTKLKILVTSLSSYHYKKKVRQYLTL